MKKLILLFFLGLNSFIHAQNFYLEANGPLPENLLYENRKKIIDEYKTSSITQSKKENLKEAFNQKADYFVYELMTSGKISFGDTVSNYLTQILHYVQSKNGDKNEVEIVLLKDEEANAFMTKKGILVMTTGLVSQVNNESELAFVIAHELVHKDEDHINKEVDFVLNDYNGNNYDKKINRYTFSKDLELEADRLALKNYLYKTNYNLDEAIGIFDVLMYGHLPIDEVEFDLRFFSHSNFEFPQNYFLKDKERNLIADTENYDDSKSSHPNMKIRKEQYIDELIKIEERNNSQVYIIGQDAFNFIQKEARNQYLLDLLQHQEYAMVLQNALILKDKYPENKTYYELCILNALQAITEYKNWHDYSKIGASVYKSEGEIQVLHQLLKKINDEEMNSMAASIAYKWMIQNPENEDFKSYANYFIKELVFFHEKALSDYQTKLPTSIEKIDTLSEEEVDELSKVDKIKYKRRINQHAEHTNYLDYTLVDVINDSTFRKTFENFEEAYDIKKEEPYFITKKQWVEESKYSYTEKKKARALGIKDILLVEPLVYYLDDRKQDYLQIDDTYKLREKYLLAFDNALAHTDLNCKKLIYNNLEEDDISSFNEIAFLQNWYTERLSHGNKNIVNSNQDFTRKIVEKYGTPYVFYPGYFGVREENNSIKLAALCLVTVYGSPVSVYFFAESFIRKYENHHFGYLFNIETGDAKMVEFGESVASQRFDYLSSNIYNYLSQISNNKK